MAQDLFSEIKYLPKGDFSQEEIIIDNTVVGKKLPTSEVVFKSDKKQRIYLELWNETENNISTFVRVNNKIYMNNPIAICEVEYPHTVHTIDINEGEEVFASAEKPNSISYNIVL